MGLYICLYTNVILCSIDATHAFQLVATYLTPKSVLSEKPLTMKKLKSIVSFKVTCYIINDIRVIIVYYIRKMPHPSYFLRLNCFYYSYYKMGIIIKHIQKKKHYQKKL